jgi:predicted TPR repeat methyltransferase
MPGDDYLSNVYKVAHGNEMRSYYDKWAAEYEAELTAKGYATPARCAQALARHLPDRAAPVLDFACGTGLAGVALRGEGFQTLDGFDLSPGMLEQAHKKGVYRDLIQADADQPMDVRARGYAAILSSGGIGVGAAPGPCIDAIFDNLAAGALAVFSLNDKSLADEDFGGRVRRAATAGRIGILEDTDGPHLPTLGLNARVFVLRRH